MSYQKKSAQKVSSNNNSSVGEAMSLRKGIAIPAVPAFQRQGAEEELQMKKEPVQKVEEEEPLQEKFEPVQKVEEEEPLQGKFEPVQKVEEEEPLQGKFEPVQKVEEEEPLQGKFEPVQKVEEEEPLQGKFEPVQKVEEEEPLQGKFEPVQKVEEEEPLQGKFESPAQKKNDSVKAFQLKGNNSGDNGSATAQLEENGNGNKTGMPNHLKSGIESLSGLSMDDVKVHYNSDKPKQLQAHAYAQGTDIHIGPGQEKHLPHEAWHVAQQKQGRVQPTMQMKQGVPVNDDKGLETEADVMGAKAVHAGAEVISRKIIQKRTMARGSQVMPGRPVQFTPEQDAAFNQKYAGIIAFSANAPAVLGMGFWSTLQPPGVTPDTVVGGAEVAGGVSGFAGDVTDEATGAGDASKALQDKTGDKTKFVDKAEGNILGAIGSSLSALVNVIKTVQSISAGVGGKTSKMEAGTAAGIALTEAIKSGFEAAINVQKFASGSVSGQLLSALPGLGLAIEAAKFVVNMFQAMEAEKAETAMTAVSAEFGLSLKAILGDKNPGDHKKLFGAEKRGKMFNRITYTRLKPGLIDEMEAVSNTADPAAKATAETSFKTKYDITSPKPFVEIYAAIRLYEMGSKMAEINQKRKVKGARDMATGLIKIGGEIAAFFPGMGTAVAGGLKGAAAGVEVAQSAAKFIQGKARDNGVLGGDKNRSSAQKHKEYVAHTKSVYRALAGMVPSPATVADTPKATKAESVLGSTGVYLPALFKTNYAEEGSVKEQAKTIIESMKAGR